MNFPTSRFCLIPARGGSKRLPRKNIIDFLGRPIIAYSIEAALASGLFAEVVVSTEDAEIAGIASRHGARVLARAPELATDAARSLDVYLDALDREEAAGRRHDVLCVLYATAPLRTADDIRIVNGLLEPGRCDFAVAVSRYPLPPHQALKVLADGFAEPMWPAIVNTLQSDLPPLVVDNGSTYAANVEAFRRERSLFGPRLRVHEMPWSRSADIDTADDLAMAEFFARRLAAESGA